MNTSPIAAQDLRQRILDGGELALLDMREEGAFGGGHLLFAVPCPFSRLELLIDDLVPRRDAPIVLCAGGPRNENGDENGNGDLIARGTERLAAFGCSDVSHLDGGTDAWAAAGYEVFTGVHVPSKAFGEFIETRYGTPHIAAAELKAMQDRGDGLVVLDSRPMAEYRAMNIPGGINVPGAELALRVHDIAPDPDTTVVVNCAGRTRSIIGAQSLINAGIPNRVVALENGTMGWHLAGFELERGASRSFPEVSERGCERARECAGKVARRFGVRSIDAGTLAKWREERDRTLYILDVRDGSDYEAGHIDGARPAPGGQLVQATDRTVGVRGARLVLVDDLGVRAAMTASWLIQMGWDDVYVLENPLAAGPLATGAHDAYVFGLEDANPETVSAKELAALMVGGGAQVVDLADSRAHRAGHIPASRFAIRANMPGNLRVLPEAPAIVLTSPTGRLARLAAADAGAESGTSGGRAVKVLDGGTRAWAEAGLPLAKGLKHALDEPVDVWYRPYDLDEGTEDAMETYLSWEVDLTAQIERDGTTRFRQFSADGAGGRGGG